MQNTENLCEQLGINEDNLQLRRQFVALNQEEKEIIQSLIPWIREHAASIVREFYDFQFRFPPTVAFFQQFCEDAGKSMSDLRSALESAQTKYLIGCFEGAESGWNCRYFEERLRIGDRHDTINLPLKWYVGSYAGLLDIVKVGLQKHYGKNLVDFVSAILAIQKVFNFDLQAVCDSFIYSTFASMGLNYDKLDSNHEMDKTEHLGLVKGEMNLLLQQAEAIADGSLNDPCLAHEVSGPLGLAFSRMVKELLNLLRSVGSSCTRLTDSVGQMRTANEDLSTSIREIANNASQAASVAATSATVTQDTNEKVNQLGNSCKEVGGVVQAITAITEQTKVLALNATIEAARAGEAGKGFAVVAHEVKELARATAAAADEIQSKILTIQSETQATISGIHEVNESMSTINESSTAIAAAAEEQSIASEQTLNATSDVADLSSAIRETLSKFQLDPVEV